MSDRFKLTKRLKFLLDEIPSGLELWDMGCDHGLLGLAAVESGHASKAYLVDPAPKVIENLKATLNSPRYVDWWRENKVRVELVQSRGENLGNRINGAVVVAGMGGETVVKIAERLEKFQTLVLNPFSHIEETREFLETRRWSFKKHSVVDRSIEYSVFVVQRPF